MNNKKHIEDILYYFEKYHYENMILDDNEAKFIHDYIINLQSKINKANELLGKILVVNDWEHKGRFRPVKNTTAQDVYKAVCMLYGILETPYRSDYGALKEDK